MFKKIGIIVLNWNGRNDTAKCLKSLQALTYPELEIVIVDNGSTDGSPDYFKSLENCTLIETGANLGYAGGNNVGIAYGLKQGFDFFLILNNDTVVDPEIIEAFLEGFKQVPEAGILGAKIYLMDEPDRFDHFGGKWNPLRLDFDYVGHRMLDDKKSWEKPLHLDYVCGAGMMVRRSVFEAIGLFEPRFFLYWEETDFCFRAKRAGFFVMTCPKAVIWHKGSASFVGGAPHAAYFFWRNRLLWIERNFKGAQRLLYLVRAIVGSLAFFYSLKGIRQAQKLIPKMRGRSCERMARYNGALLGIKDYLMRRFGSGNSKKFMNCH